MGLCAMLGLFRKPPWILLGAMVGILVWQIAQHRLAPERNEDSHTYLISMFPLSDSLQSIRTLGYPALLHVVRTFSPTLDAMPLVHLLLLDAAVLAFYFGLRKLGAVPWLAFCVAGSLLYFPPMLTHGTIIVPEVASAACAVFTIAMLFWVVSCPQSLLASFGFCTGLFLTYQMRPAYLFLIILTPLLGVTLRYCYARTHGDPSLVLRLGRRLTALAVLPYIGFCLFRWCLVGHFGLVSFGGMNLIGVAGQFLNEETIVGVPAHLQPWAHKVLEIRATSEDWPRDHAKERLCFRDAEPLYNIVIYRQFLPAYKSLPEAEHSYKDASRKCSELSLSLIKVRPHLYACWVGDAFRTGLFRLPALSWYPPLQTVTLYLLTILGYFGLVRLIQRSRLRRIRTGEQHTEGFWFISSCLVLTATSFALCKLLLICLVEAPIARYLDAVYLFVPTLTGLLAYGAAMSIRNHVIATVTPRDQAESAAPSWTELSRAAAGTNL
jgi:hypothetical protein